MELFQFTALLLTLIGALLIYSTSKHQRLFRRPQPKVLAWLGSCLWLFAFFSWYQLLTPTAAVFTWLFTAMTLLICVPLSTLFQDREEG
ncbi:MULTISPECIES: hypothetical protein [Shewanella]|uniref:DUF3325 domain-containing protein n=1 Tax=Shewanella fidelis TaxID=173509 RepID=A0AAW8NIJ3_9GAMM|nr:MULTISPECIES: hypothetical protein [Shewanella]MDR8522522.1 hypothetical protein [Shewanella fidelis]MDW4812944.1 hypothetical protein [Shewanella fidelis]MDW4816797.1 hypothetical protein [Shewanella fidelis]MDW4820951.1 hypothetical protein [Shewanella fidelis]MDW4825514.1 hypothetical protein [Shewanella fidelis]